MAEGWRSSGGGAEKGIRDRRRKETRKKMDVGVILEAEEGVRDAP